MIVLQPPLPCEGWGDRPLCFSRDSSVLMDLHWPCDCTDYGHNRNALLLLLLLLQLLLQRTTTVKEMCVLRILQVW